MAKQIFFLLAGICLLASCAPRVNTTLVKSYAALDKNEPVEVYFRKSEIPSQYEVLGEVGVGDTGFTSKCDSVTIVGILQDKAREIGGNALLITKHTKPSVWKSSCHQMTAAVLKIDGSSFNLAATSDTPEPITEAKTKQERLLPKVRFATNFGYGWRTAKANPDLNDFGKFYYDGLKSGPVWDASVDYYFSDTYGIGLLYAAYSASNSAYGTDMNTGVSGIYNTKHLFTFVGPVFKMRGATNNNKWLFDLGFGIGYLGYKSDETFSVEKVKMTGPTVGFSTSIGIEYKLSENWGIGANISTVSGVLTRITKDHNGVKQTLETDYEHGEGLGQFRLSAGIRYYIK